MPWGKIDDRAWRHVRFDGVSLSAYGLFWAAISYSNEKLLDGLLTPQHLAQLRGFRQAPEELVSELVEAGLWLKTPAGYQIHDYFQYNDSKIEILERKRKNAEAQEQWRKRQKQEPGGNVISNSITNEHVPYPGTPVPGTRFHDSVSLSAPNRAQTPSGRERKSSQNGVTHAEPCQALVDAKIAAMEDALAVVYFRGKAPTGKPLADLQRAAVDLVEAGVFPADVKRLRERVHEAFPKYATVPVYALARHAGLLLEPERPAPGLPLPAEPEPHGPPASDEVIQANLAEIAAKMKVKR